MRIAPVISLLALESALFMAPIAQAQAAAGAARVPARIVDRIDENQLVTLKGNTLPVAIPKNDMGPVRPDLQLTDLVLVLSRSPEQQAAFDTFVASQYDASSPSFHHWLVPAEVGEEFGPSAADIAIISNWLAGHGLVVTAVSKDRMAVRFSGTDAQVESAFHVEIHNLKVEGRAHIANISDPQIPAALAPVVMGVKALNDFHPRPLHTMGRKVQYDSATGMWTRVPAGSQAAGSANAAAAEPAGVLPEFGVAGSAESFPTEDVAPYDFATIYNVLPLWNANIDGTGETIAIAATSDVNPSDIASYRSIFGLPAGPAVNTIVANGVDPGQCTLPVEAEAPCSIEDLEENTLDAEVSGAVAKGAQIDLVVSGGTSPALDRVYSSASYVVDNDTAKILSVSYGECELFLGTSGNAAWNNLWETAAVEGIGVFIATGDSGSPTCDQLLQTSIPYGAQDGLSVSGMASTPYDTAVGGTDYAWCNPTINSSGNTVGCSTVTPYWNTSNNATTGVSAAGYVTEVPWNDSCASPQGAAYLDSLATFLGILGVTDAETACNFVVNDYFSIYAEYGVDLAPYVESIGGSGGASTCTVNATTSNTGSPAPSSCSGGYAKPSWQANVMGIPSDGKRDIPDVSFFAGNGAWQSATVICVSEGGACVSTTSPATAPSAQEVGGTSVAAPEMAGVMALINQKVGAAQGNPNAELYALAGRQTYSSCSAESVKTSSSCYFNDIDTSTNATPCMKGALDCTVTHSSDSWGILSGFSATTGFDEATGLGSLNVANVVNNWSTAGGTAAATVTITPSQNAITINQGLTVTVTVTGASGTPTGTVGLATSGYTATAAALSSGSYTFTIPAYSLAAGADTLTIGYGGDTNYAQTTGTASITVSKLTPAVAVTPSPATVGANAKVNVEFSVTGAGHTPTGSVQLSGGGASGTCTLTNGACGLALSSNTLANGTDTLTANYSGDPDYAAAVGSASLTVFVLTPTMTVVPSPVTLDTATTLQVQVTLAGTGPTPTGNVSLTGLYGYWTHNGTLSNGSYTFSVNPGQLAPGSDTLTVTYGGDKTYTASSTTTTVTVSKATPAMTATPSPATIYTNQSVTISGTIGPPTGVPTGSITVSSGGTTVATAQVTSQTYKIMIPANSLSAGADILTVAYGGNTFYNAASTTTTVNVAQWTKIAPSITVTPTPTTIDSGQGLQVNVSVTGTDGAPTGTLTLMNGGTTLASGSLGGNLTAYQFSLAGNVLPAGSVTLTLNYSGDSTYLAGSGTATVTVTQSLFALSATSPAAIAPGSPATSTISVSTSTGYTGTVTLACSLTSGPSNQPGDAPACSVPGTPIFAGNTMNATVTTAAAATTSALVRPESPRRNRGLAGGAVALAMLILFGIPARRRSWRAMLGMVALLAALGMLAACNNKAGGGGGGTSNPGTAAGAYTFTVTATGNPAVAPAPTATFTVTVN